MLLISKENAQTLKKSISNLQSKKTIIYDKLDAITEILNSFFI